VIWLGIAGYLALATLTYVLMRRSIMKYAPDEKWTVKDRARTLIEAALPVLNVLSFITAICMFIDWDAEAKW
jgi:hypothetical protein